MNCTDQTGRSCHQLFSNEDQPSTWVSFRARVGASRPQTTDTASPAVSPMLLLG